MLRYRGVEHVDTDDAVAGHKEEGPDEHDPVPRHPGPPDCGGQPEDVDWNPNRQDWIYQTGLEIFCKCFAKDSRLLNTDLEEVKIDESTGSIQDQCQ